MLTYKPKPRRKELSTRLRLITQKICCILNNSGTYKRKVDRREVYDRSKTNNKTERNLKIEVYKYALEA